MAQQKAVGEIRLQIPAGKATPAPPVGPALGQHGVNIGQFTKDFNDRTKNDEGLIIPVVITVYADRSFSFITKTPPAPVLLKKACNLEKASGSPKANKVATISIEEVRKIAEMKMPDLNASDVESAMRMIAGTARSMGIVVKGADTATAAATAASEPAESAAGDSGVAPGTAPDTAPETAPETAEV